MDELGQLILGSPQKSNKREPTFDEIKAAKKSYSGANPQL